MISKAKTNLKSWKKIKEFQARLWPKQLKKNKEKIVILVKAASVVYLNIIEMGILWLKTNQKRETSAKQVGEL